MVLPPQVASAGYSWQDYDVTALGGLWRFSLKSVALLPQAASSGFAPAKTTTPNKKVAIFLFFDEWDPYGDICGHIALGQSGNRWLLGLACLALA